MPFESVCIVKSSARSVRLDTSARTSRQPSSANGSAGTNFTPQDFPPAAMSTTAAPSSTRTAAPSSLNAIVPGTGKIGATSAAGAAEAARERREMMRFIYSAISPSSSEMQRDQLMEYQPFSMRARMRLRPFSRWMRR